ncbi:MAG: hypothetical protein NTY20_04950 [Candidatus Aenigmarchaeota archaeon]|nr:hypothetical protein [Candidatus Aenigmarchaeota archaeon]
MKIETFGMREAGISLIIVSAILFFVLLSVTGELNKLMYTECNHPPGEVCPMESSLPIQSYAGFTLDFVVAGFGGFLIYKSKQSEKFVSAKRKEIEKTLKELDEDEKKVYELISSSDGVVFQSDIVEKTGFPKVKITRILDRMEHRGLVERRRRGMSNIVLIKK